MARIHVGGLGPDPDKRKVENEFEYYGDLLDVWLSRPPFGYGFVEYKSTRDAEDAIREMEGRKIDGYRITLDWARRPRRDGPRGTGDTDRGFSDRGRGRGGFSGGPPRGRVDLATIKCYECNRMGHFARDCRRSRSPLPRSPVRQRSPVERRAMRSFSRSRSRSPVGRGRSPVGRGRSPVGRGRSPVRRSRSPPSRGRSPEERSMSRSRSRSRGSYGQAEVRSSA